MVAAQAEKKLWPIAELPDLYRASLEIDAQVNAEIAAEVERQSHLLMQAFGGLTHAQKVEKWQAEWSSWTEYRSYSGEPTSEEKLLKAIFGDDALSEEEKSEGEEIQPKCLRSRVKSMVIVIPGRSFWSAAKST